MQQVVNVLATASSIALFAVGFSLLFGVLGVLNFAHGTVMACGAYGGIVVVRGLHWPIGLAVVGGIVGGALASLLIEQVVFRPLRGRNASPFLELVATIGAAQAITAVIAYFTKAQPYFYPKSSLLTSSVNFVGATVSTVQLLMFALAVVSMLILNFAIFRTGVGRATRAVAADPEIASAMGVRVSRVWSAGFLVAGALAGVTGVFVGMVTQLVDTNIGDNYLLIGFIAAVIGGLGSVRGAVVGAIVIAAIQVLGQAYFSGTVANVFPYAVLFVFIIWRPTGLFGTQVERV